MRRFVVISGILGLLLLGTGAGAPRPVAAATPPPTGSASAASVASSASSRKTLYMRIKDISEKQVQGDIEPDVAMFIKSLVQAEYNVTFEPDDISAAARAPGAFQARCGEKGLQANKCQDLERQIRRIAEREERVRKLGRELHFVVSGYEVPLSEHLGKFAAVAPPLGGLLTIWASGSDRVTNPDAFLHFTAAPFPDYEDTTQEKYEELKNELDELVEEADGPKEDLSELAAAVARYRFGYKAVRAEGSCSGVTGGAGELGQLTRRWCAVEDELHDVWNHLKSSLNQQPNPPGGDEVVFFPTWLFEDINVVVWASNRDAGLDWEIPLEPVLPRMVDDREYKNCREDGNDDAYCSSVHPVVTLRGGALLDPPLPPDIGKGICAMPFGAHGYLCKPIEQEECAIASSSSAGSSNSTGTGIYLTSCKEPLIKTPARMTLSGPDVCGIGGWRIPTEPPSEPDTPARQLNMRPGQCSNCAVDIYCSSSCPGGGAFTDPRESSGRIGICMPQTVGSGSTAIMSNLILHELVHAQQSCSNPRSLFSGDLEHCCSGEYQAYLVQCIALAEDGILNDVEIKHQGKRLPITPEFCAATLTTLSCSGLGQCSESPIPPSMMKDKILESLERNKARLGLPTSCAAAVNQLDARAKAILASLPRACTPKCRSEFENTIGNNLCYIGQCIEQSWEEERFVPGRMSQNVGDEAFPWDSCIGTEPAANTDPPATSLVTLPTLTFPPLPDYRPWDIANITDKALCQLLGLPARTPPTVCAGEVSRQLGRPLSDPLDMMINLATAVEDQLDPAVELERMAPSVGTRYATSLYRSQLGAIRRSFVEIFDVAAVMLEEISKTSFPQQMCSRVDRACPYLSSQ